MNNVIFRNAQILTMARASQPGVISGDLHVQGNTIVTVGGRAEAPAATEINATEKLIMPGLVNAHTHSSEMFFRGRYERMPLETWLLYAYPYLGAVPLPSRLLYLRTMLVAIESIRSGVTMISDDFFEAPGHNLDRLSTVFAAYRDSGIRANISSAVMNVPALDSMAFARDIVPLDLQNMLDATPPIALSRYTEFCQAVFRSLHEETGRLRFMLAPSAPQRCTPELLQAAMALALEKRVPFHTHVLETKTQAVTGDVLFGKSLVRYMHELNVLNCNTTIAHSVWVSEEDIELMGAAGCSVAHNAISNQKLGAGLAPVRRLLDAGVHVGLGTDGACSNDTLRIFDVMRVAALVQSTTGPDPQQWLSARDVLHAATIGGARTALLDHFTGTLEPGKAADLIMLDLQSLNFLQRNDIERQLVYAENGSSLELVMIDGRIVLRYGRLTTISEDDILEELRESLPMVLADHASTEERNKMLEPYFAEIHRRATSRGIAINRYAGDATSWQ